MNKYETIFLLNIKLLEKDQKKILDKIIKCISDFGKTILKTLEREL